MSGLSGGLPGRRDRAAARLARRRLFRDIAFPMPSARIVRVAETTLDKTSSTSGRSSAVKGASTKSASSPTRDSSAPRRSAADSDSHPRNVRSAERLQNRGEPTMSRRPSPAPAGADSRAEAPRRRDTPERPFSRSNGLAPMSLTGSPLRFMYESGFMRVTGRPSISASAIEAGDSPLFQRPPTDESIRSTASKPTL